MLKKINNRKGFTLIELLAVIVIMGVLMMVAIPAMTRYIENSKRDVFADTAKKYISSVRYTLLSDGFVCSSASCGLSDLDSGNTIIFVPASLVELDNNTNLSPWNKKFDGTKAWIIVKNSGTSAEPKYEYGFYGSDDGGNGISNPTSGLGVTETGIARLVVKKGIGVQTKPKCPIAATCLTATKLS